MSKNIENDSLCHAIWEEDFNKVSSLVESGTDLNRQGRNGYTPLMQAAEMENVQIAKLLIEHGSDINSAGHEGATPLHIAVDISIDGTIQNGGSPGEEPLEMIRFLLKNGADTRLTDSKGKSALNWAEDYKSQKVIKALQNERS